MSFGGAKNLPHLILLAGELPLCFSFHCLHIQWSQVAAISFLNADSDFSAKLCEALLLKILSLIEPEKQLIALGRIQLFHGVFDFGNCAHAKNLANQ